MQFKKNRNIFLVSLCVIMAFNAAAQQKNNEIRKIPTLLPLDPAVHTGKLANGFTYYIRHNEEPKGRVLLYLANKAGSILENDDQQGLAHFMEHMSFNGTTHFPKHQLVDYLQRSGVRFGADLNAYTSYDETVYQLPIPTTPAILENGLQIMRDWAHEAILDSVAINSERGVVLEEKRMRKGAFERIENQYLPTVLNHSQYAVREPIGIDTVLDNFKPEAIKRFYHDWYRPDLQAIIVVGDIDVDQIEKEIKLKFSDLKNPVNERPRIKYTTTLTGQNHFFSISDPEATSTSVRVLILQPKKKIQTAAQYREEIVQRLFNNMLGDRYTELLQQANPPFLYGKIYSGDFMAGLDAVDGRMVANTGQLESSFKGYWRETERIKRFGFTQTELDRAKTSYLNGIISLLKEKDKNESENFVEEYLQNFLQGTTSPGITTEYELVKKDLPSITLQSVNQFAIRQFKTTDRDIIIVAPEKEKSSLPNESIVNNWLTDLDHEKLKPYNDKITDLTLLKKQPEGGSIISKTQDTVLGTTKLVLSNGVTILLKPTDFKNNEIDFTSFSEGGTSLYNDSAFQSAQAAAKMISSFGAGNLNPAQLSKYLNGKQVSVAPYIAERTQGFDGVTEPAYLKNALELLYGYATEPRKDTALYTGFIKNLKGSLANRAENPNSVFNDSVNAVLYNNNVRHTGPSVKKTGQLNLDTTYHIYQNAFSDASGMNFIFVGSFNPTDIEPLLVKYLGALPSLHKHINSHDVDIPIAAGKISKTVYKGSEPKAVVLLTWSGTADYNAINKLRFDALRECIQIRALERLRGEENEVYSPGVSVKENKYPIGRYVFQVNFTCAPQNANKLIAATVEEVNKIRVSGPSAIDLEKWRNETNAMEETRLKSNSFWLYYLLDRLQYNEDLHQVHNNQALINGISVQNIKDAANQYLNGDNFIQLLLQPESSRSSK